MTDDPTVRWRLDQIENRVQDLATRAISPELYARDRAELERDIADLRRHLDKVEEDCLERVEKSEKRISERLDKSGTNWRQSLFSGVLPMLFLALTLLVTVLLALRGTGK